MKKCFIWVWLAGFAGAVSACDTPVFRYALEKWMPENYTASVFFSGELSDAEQECVRLLKSNVNVDLSVIDVEALRAGFDPAPYAFEGVAKAYRKSAAQKEAEKKEREARRVFAQHLQLYEKHDAGQRLPSLTVTSPVVSLPLYQGGLSAVGLLVDSPARAEIAQKILSGDSSVFVLLLSGDEALDGRCRDALDAALRMAEERVVLSIPENNTKLAYATPLLLKFSVVEVRRDDPEELFFVQNLMQLSEKSRMPHVCSDGACYISGDKVLAEEALRGHPLVVPIIGRGRAVDLLDGLAISAEGVFGLCQYICGQCSCEIKMQNPGMDLLFAVDWANGFVPMMGPPDEEIELYGLSNYQEPPREKNSTRMQAEPELAVGIEKTKCGGWSVLRSVAVTAGVVLLILSVGTGMILRLNKDS